MWRKRIHPKLFVIASLLLHSCLSCIQPGVPAPCNEDCECCGYPENPSVRCERRHWKLGKRCYISNHHDLPCQHDNQCISQNCVNGVCVPKIRPGPYIGYCPIANSGDIIAPVSGSLPECACHKDEATVTVEAAMDNNLSSDYVNYFSKDFSGVIVDPHCNAPLRKLQICSANGSSDNDPLCYRLEGQCEGETDWTLLQEGDTGLTTTRQECQTITVAGNPRVSYTKYKITFGCRRKEYLDGPDCCEVDPQPKFMCKQTQFPWFVDKTDDDPSFFGNLVLTGAPTYKASTDKTEFIYEYDNSGPNLGNFLTLQWDGKCCLKVTDMWWFDQFNVETHPTHPFYNRKWCHVYGIPCFQGLVFPSFMPYQTKYYFKIEVEGKHLTTVPVLWNINDQLNHKIGYVQGPSCHCRDQTDRRLLTTKSKGLILRRKAPQICSDEPMMISELKLLGKCNEC